MEGLNLGKSIEIFTLTMGGPIRELYLQVLCRSLVGPMEIYRDLCFATGVRHTVFFQGARPSRVMADFLEDHQVRVFVWPANIGRALGQKKALTHCMDADIILRTDDDARILEDDFFLTLNELVTLLPGAFLHAFPVGLTNNMGGCKASKDRFCVVTEEFDRIYTVRPVKRMGGLARAADPATWAKIPWKDDLGKGPTEIESAQMMRACEQQEIPLYYIENGWVVEHQDSTQGQKFRKERGDRCTRRAD